MQCDRNCSEYTACLSPCPLETCDNILDQAKDERMCHSDSCFEGCHIKPCPEGKIYLNSSYTECVPMANCKTVCLIVNDAVYYEGDIMKTDDCQTCHCSRGKQICSGVPCKITTTTTTLVPINDNESACISGWSPWINQDKTYSQNDIDSGIDKNLKVDDNEPLPSQFLLKNIGNSVNCPIELIKRIECRSVGSKLNLKQTGEDCECSLEKGLKCIGPCHDYEIRVLCDCADDIEILSYPTTMPYPQVIPQKIIQYKTTERPHSDKCDPTVPHIEYPGDCNKFLHCQPTIDGSWRYVEKTCGPSMMFNPESMVCDWPDSVILQKPSCGKTAPIVTQSEPEGKCTYGEVYSACAVPCGKSCHFYERILKKQGVCYSGSEPCIEGCTPYGSAMCIGKMLWRDNSTCVTVEDCPCISNEGYLVKVYTFFYFGNV